MAADNIILPIRYTSNSIILAYQKKIGPEVIEELLRVATFFLGTFGKTKATELMVDYVNTCVIC